MFETKLFIHPSYSLHYRGRKLALSDRHGLIMSMLMTARGRVARVSVVSEVYQNEVRATGVSGYDFHKVEFTMRELDALLENWPLTIEREGMLFYRLTELSTKHRTSGGI